MSVGLKTALGEKGCGSCHDIHDEFRGLVGLGFVVASGSCRLLSCCHVVSRCLKTLKPKSSKINVLSSCSLS